LREQLNNRTRHKGWHSPVRDEWQTGIRNAEGLWAVRFRIHAGGSATSRIGRERSQRLGDNWIDADGHPTFRQSLPEDRDY
jgi:hypothetical protein